MSTPSPERVIHDARFANDCDCTDPEAEGRLVIAALNASGYVVVRREELAVVVLLAEESSPGCDDDCGWCRSVRAMRAAIIDRDAS